MKLNYNSELNAEIKSLKYIPKLLLHSCCGPCSSYVISYLTKYFNITILYYNPNIFPKKEYIKRKAEQIKLINNINKINDLSFIDSDYDNISFKKVITNLENEPEGGKRCINCISLRLEKTCQLAKKYKYDYFCTTLTVSPHKNCEMINSIGNTLQNKYDVKWLYSDFKKEDGYKKSIELSKKYNLYRQSYCGCKYSINNDHFNCINKNNNVTAKDITPIKVKNISLT